MKLDRGGLVVVTGAGGFIGGHLVAALRERGFASIRAVDVKPVPQWYQHFENVDARILDLQEREHCAEAADGATTIFNLASDMGGMGFIESNKALCMLSVLINTHMLMAAREVGATTFLYASSACVYAAEKQTDARVTALREEDAYPAEPEDGYGWEKLFGERMCRHFEEDFGLAVRLPRFHNVYGPHGTYVGGREKAPSAICRKVIEAKLSGDHSIEIWGDGEQTRSFTYIDDAVEGTLRLMESNVSEPLNIGSDELVTINRLVDIVESIANIKLERRYNLDAPQGVRGRNSDNTKIKELLGWAPSVTLEEGLERTFRWIYDEMTSNEAERQLVSAR
jgi:GDP-D-mannose 3',5'-epimerase